jgi:hypothetical protein
MTPESRIFPAAPYLSAAARAIAALYPEQRTQISIRDFVALLHETAETKNLDRETLVSLGFTILLVACQRGLAKQVSGRRRPSLSDRYDLSALARGCYVIVLSVEERKDV